MYLLANRHASPHPQLFPHFSIVYNHLSHFMTKFILNPQQVSSTQTVNSTGMILKGPRLVKNHGVAATPDTTTTIATLLNPNIPPDTDHQAPPNHVLSATKKAVGPTNTQKLSVKKPFSSFKTKRISITKDTPNLLLNVVSQNQPSPNQFI
ncbi:BgTH12-00991 [Blumeria graminis f. sp. triticale]|uniref:BgTH12-00991 n=1 Tax=Blumeria graminis f. sp. triticale TaxID=1689686 RepID=A0A9W4DCV1_BLUGR|nr:BgTH12-00991 [Blumeria graminis f. sp. triticale]